MAARVPQAGRTCRWRSRSGPCSWRRRSARRPDTDSGRTEVATWGPMVEPGGYGSGYNVRVSFSRGRFRVVVGPSSVVSGGRRVVVSGAGRRPRARGVGARGARGGGVVAGVDVRGHRGTGAGDDLGASRSPTTSMWCELDPLGSSTKYCGACSGWLYCWSRTTPAGTGADHDQTHDAGADHGRCALVPRPPVGVVVAVAGHGH